MQSIGVRGLDCLLEPGRARMECESGQQNPSACLPEGRCGNVTVARGILSPF
jgi:hypothetical protein